MTTRIIFVFGSNLAGRHGAGAAVIASRDFGAAPGEGEGLWGNSYAIPTKNTYLKTMSLRDIAKYVERFKVDAWLQWDKERYATMFLVTEVGTGLAGYSHREMASLFQSSPPNCFFSPRWAPYLDRADFHHD